MKRFKIFFLIIAISTCLIFNPSLAYDPSEEVEFNEITPGLINAVERGLAYLVKNQQPDGAWIDRIGRKESGTYVGHDDKHVGATALAAIALMSYGHFPGRGEYGENVEKAISWLCEKIDKKGYISFSESRMYSHAFATLALAEAYGMCPHPELEEKLKKAIRLISNAQNSQGAWRYKPGAPDSDLSITVCQIMALRSARNAGIYINKGVIENAIDYVKKSYTTNGFKYQVYESGTRTSFALTAAGVVALQGAGEYDSMEAKKGIEYMFGLRASDLQVLPENMHRSFDYFYAHYYAVQAMFQAGGVEWSEWFRKVREDLILGQKKYRDGRWQDLVGPNYATAMATIILQIPFRYLPIFER